MPSAEQLSFATISCVTMPGADGTPALVPHRVDRLIPAVAAAGFRRIGLDWFTVRDAERTGADLGRLLADHELVPTELCAMGLGEDPAADERVARSMARRCQQLGIPVCVLASTPPVSPALCARVAAIAEVFGNAGTRVGVEFMPFSGIRTLADALVLRDAAGVGIVLDTLHLLRSGCAPAELESLDATDIACVQLADGSARPERPLAEESRAGRLLPGAGAADLAGYGAALDRIGYTGPVSIEVLSATLRTLPPEDLALAFRAAGLQYADGD
jgi:sugar phosphate isomerase/epimerase